MAGPSERCEAAAEHEVAEEEEESGGEDSGVISPRQLIVAGISGLLGNSMTFEPMICNLGVLYPSPDA